MSRVCRSLLTAVILAGCSGGESTGPVPVSEVELNRTIVQLAVGDSVLLVATLRDSDGNTLTGRTLDWASSNSGVASVTSAGWVHANAAGNATITAASGTITAQAQVSVNTAPLLTSVSPALLTPGVSVTITGTGFSATANQNTVTIDGVAAALTAATPTQLTVTMAAAGAYPCTATHNATVAVTVAGITGNTTHPMQVAVQQALAPGQSLNFASAAEARCNEFSQTGGRYFVTVFRPDNTLNATSAFQLKGQSATGLSADVAALTPAASPRSMVSPDRSVAAARGLLQPFAMVSQARRAAAARQHRAMLEEDLRLARGRLPMIRQRVARPSLDRSRASFAIGTVGDTADIKIPNRSLPAGQDFCRSAPINIRARTVYAGAHAIILEDVASPLAGTIDAVYQALGQEFDADMFDIVTANFGNPLAYDSQTDANGKILMLFSKQVNDFGGILGFVTTCDFFDPAANPELIASNKAEIFYAIAPTEPGSGFPGGNNTYTVDEWRRIIRSTLIHETKHLAMFAERIADPNALVLEDSWLEEGMAMHSEELYSRGITGATWKGNTGYGGGGANNHIWCELRPTTAGCIGRPLVMTSHFGFLYQYLTDIENRTLVGGVGGTASDGSFYGSAWAFVRWMLDAYAANESAVLQALTKEPAVTGATNLAARSGVPYETMLPQFHYAIRYDDATGIAPAAPWQHIQSWNVPAIYAGLHTDLPTFFVADYLLDHPVPFGNFTVNISTLRGGTAAHFELTGTQAAKQLIALQAQNGAAPDPSLRMTVFRVQ